jgi:hypothetical protein
MAIVPALLRTVAKVVGCRVDCFQLSVHCGAWLNLDVWDPDFCGQIDRDILMSALVTAVSERTSLTVVNGGRCTDEGLTVTVAVRWLQDDVLSLQVGG